MTRGRPRGARDSAPRIRTTALTARVAAVLERHPEWRDKPAMIAAELGDATRQAVWAALRRVGRPPG